MLNLNGISELLGSVDKLAERLHSSEDTPDRKCDDSCSPRFIRRVHFHFIWKYF